MPPLKLVNHNDSPLVQLEQLCTLAISAARRDKWSVAAIHMAIGNLIATQSASANEDEDITFSLDIDKETPQ